MSSGQAAATFNRGQFQGNYAPRLNHQQQQNNPQGPQSCYNCGSTQHWAQYCPEPRRVTPAFVSDLRYIGRAESGTNIHSGSMNEAPRQQARPQKKTGKPGGPVITRYAPPQGYMLQQSITFTQLAPTAHPQSSNYSQQQQYYSQQCQGYTVPQAQQWQQNYSSPVSTPVSAYSPQKPNAYQGYHQPIQPHLNQQNLNGGYQAQGGYPQKPPTPQFNQTQHNQNPQFYHPQPHHPQTPSFQQYMQQLPVPTSFSPVAVQQLAQGPTFNGNSISPTRQFSPPMPPNSIPTPPPLPPPLKPPLCFPQAEVVSGTTTKSGLIIWRPAQPTKVPLEATFEETEARNRRNTPNPRAGTLKDEGWERFIEKFDANRRRKSKHFLEPDDEEIEDPVFKSVRTGGTMLVTLDDLAANDIKMEDDDELNVDVKNGETESNGHVGKERNEAHYRGLGKDSQEDLGHATSTRKESYGNSDDPPRPRHDAENLATNTMLETIRRSTSPECSSHSPSGGSAISLLHHQEYRKRESYGTSILAAPPPSKHALPPKPTTVPPPYIHHRNDHQPKTHRKPEYPSHPRQLQTPSTGRRSASPSRQFHRCLRHRERDYDSKPIKLEEGSKLRIVGREREEERQRKEQRRQRLHADLRRSSSTVMDIYSRQW